MTLEAPQRLHNQDEGGEVIPVPLKISPSSPSCQPSGPVSKTIVILIQSSQWKQPSLVYFVVLEVGTG